MNNIPNHIAIIMDGNGRWAAKHNKERIFGHYEGVKTVKNIVKSSIKFGVKYLTLYAFSTENWNRTDEEIDGLMTLFVHTISEQIDELYDNGVRLRFIGDIGRMSDEINKSIEFAENKTLNNEKLNLVIALNYSSKWEILNAVKNIIKAKITHIDEKVFESQLSTANIPDPDLLIRTSGELRISNFLLWQCAYTEFYFTDTLWPEFDENEYKYAIEEYSKRDRRFGVTQKLI